MKWKLFIPNLLSLSRWPLGYLVYANAHDHQWSWALTCMILGFATDGLDGYLAIKLNAQSSLGKYLDGYGDAALILGIAAGVVLTGVVPWQLATAMGALAICIWSPMIFCKRTTRLRILCEGLNSFYAVSAGIFFISMYIYELHNVWVWAGVLFVAVVIGIPILKLKRHRWMFWIGQVTGREKRSQFD